MSEIEEEGPSEIKGQNNAPPNEKKRKIEGGGAKEKYGAESSEEALSSEFGEDEDEEDVLRRTIKFYEDRNAPEWLLKRLQSIPNFHESDSDSDYLAEGETEVNWALWDEYEKQIEETEGFGLKVSPGSCVNAHAQPVLDFKKSEFLYKLLTELSDLAIKDYNKNNIGKDFKLVDVEWAVKTANRGILYLLTFKAEDAQEGVKTFEAKVLDGIACEKPEVFLCRMKKQTDA